MRRRIDALEVQVPSNCRNQPWVIYGTRNITDRFAETENSREIEAMDIAQVTRASRFPRQKLKTCTEIRMNTTRRIVLTVLWPIAVAPKSNRIVDVGKLGLSRQVDSISSCGNHVVETKLFA